MRELITAFRDLADSDALGIVLAGNGPVFSAGHDLADVAGADLRSVRSLLQTCTELMTVMVQIPQPVVARVHGLATAAESKGIGKQALYAQIDLDQPKAYAYAVEVMAATRSHSNNDAFTVTICPIYTIVDYRNRSSAEKMNSSSHPWRRCRARNVAFTLFAAKS
jgi:hypothetical protein